MSWTDAALRWYLVLAAVTWGFAPMGHWLCDRLPDRGVTLLRPIALLAAVYPAWVLASLGTVGFDNRVLTATTVLIAIAAWGAAIWRRTIDGDWLRALVLVELASLGLFAAYIWLHGYTPQIMGTEKPMDVAFLASSARSTAMPPADPWFTGESINYYYLGYLLFGSMARLASVTPEFAFNLTLATIFSSTVVAAFGVAWCALRGPVNRAAATVAGLLAAFGVALAGNLYTPWRLLQDAPATVAAFWWDSAVGIGWRSSRIVCDGPRVGNLCPPPATETINEFPFFSFLLGDLHPHLMALPFTLVAIGLSLSFALGLASSGAAWHWGRISRLAVAGAIVGALIALNAWDFPTFIGLALLAIYAGAGFSWRPAIGPMVTFVAAALLAWSPFLASYTPPTAWSGGGPRVSLPVVSTIVSTLGVHSGERTSVLEYLTVFGVPHVISVVFLAIGWSTAEPDRQDGFLRTAAIAAVATVVPGVLLSAPVIPLCGMPLAFAFVELCQTRSFSPRVFALALASIAWLLSIGVEIFYVRDAFDDRMNTLFKFYYQTWTLYALAAAVAIPLLWSAAHRSVWQRRALAVAVVLIIMASAAYPIVGSYQWTGHFETWRGLDGLAYGEASSPGDVAAIRWLEQHASPGDVVLEAAGCSYRPFDRLPFNRVAAFTGVPTVIGWGDNHQRQWRAGQPRLLGEIPERQADVAAMYADPQSTLFDQYGIDWLVVGDYESGNWRDECASAGPYRSARDPAFPGPGWEEAFHSDETTIYRRSS